MSNTLTTTLLIQPTWSYSTPRGSWSAVDANVNKYSFLLGSTALDGMTTATMMWRDSRTVTSGSPNDDLDLKGGVNEIFGAAFNPTAIVAILIVNNSTNAGDKLLVGGAASNPITSLFNGSGTAKVIVGPSSPLLLSDFANGFSLSAGSADVLRVAYSGASGSIDYDIFVWAK